LLRYEIYARKAQSAKVVGSPGEKPHRAFCIGVRQRNRSNRNRMSAIAAAVERRGISPPTKPSRLAKVLDI
jgi:hypothetical protein